MKTKTFFLISTLIILIGITVILNQFAMSKTIIPFNLDRPLASLYRLEHTVNPVVFLGDSRTKYQVDTEYLNNTHALSANVTNGGINGFYYPYQIAAFKVAANNPNIHKIYFSMPIRDIFGKVPLNPGNFGNFISPGLLLPLLMMPQVGLNLKGQMVSAAVNNIIDLHYILYYLQTTLMPNDKFSSSSQYCQQQSASLFQKVYVCKNGDGYIISNSAPKRKSIRNVVVNIDNVTNGFLYTFMNMKQMTSATHKDLYLVLLPEYGVKYQIDIKQLEAKLGVTVIDMSHTFKNESDIKYWVIDEGHLNQQGREIYTKLLINKIVDLKN